ncbi:hypothetical protein HanPSC8_Chr02g0080731 [Helianthus annuus]|nr:hypothetical protein HanPSC8_Chr02g0080731 [Helianthus annuus]
MCPNLQSYAQSSSYDKANLANAFNATCNIHEHTPDWCADSGATAHMTSTESRLDSSSPYYGTDKVAFGNGSNNRENPSQREA